VKKALLVTSTARRWSGSFGDEQSSSSFESSRTSYARQEALLLQSFESFAPKKE